MPRAKPADISKGEAFGFLAEKLKQQAREPNINGYNPHFKQETFHRSVAKVKLYIGGNRSGKTHAGVVEDIWRLKGEHPFRRIPEGPVRGRAVCVDFRQGINEILIPKFKQLMPPSLLKNGSWDRSYNTTEKKLTCANGSTLEFMTYEQNIDAFAGTSRHFIHFDEEPPKGIYNECMARLIDTDGDAYLTMTPLLGMTWIYDEIYTKGLDGDPFTDVIIVDITENPYIKAEARDRFLNSLDPDEREARKSGKFIQLGGLVYKQFHRDFHTIPYSTEVLKQVRQYELYSSMDHGYNAPSAWLWHGVAADGTIVTFAEHYQAEWTVNQHAHKVLEIESGLEIDGKVTIRVADPATAQRQGVTGTSIQTEYALNGVDLSPGNNDVQTGVAKVQQYLRINPATGKPYWIITDNCTNLIREMERLRWATYSTKKAQFDNNAQEKIHKKDDHAADSARYFFSFMPDLTPDPVAELKPFEKPTLMKYDEALAKMGSAETQWSMSTDSTSSLEWD